MTVQTLTTKIKNRHGLNIAVCVEIPDNPKGLAFIVHGFRGFKEQAHIAAMADVTLDAHLVTVRFDCTNALGESDGSVSDATCTSCIADLEDVIAWAKTQDWYQAPFMLAGHSMGGIALLEYCKDHPRNVLAIAPVATCISGTLLYETYHATDPVALDQWKRTGWQIQTSKAKPEIGNIHLPWSWMEDTLRYDALAYAHQLDMPCFIFTGSNDSTCPPHHQQMLFDRWGGNDKEIHLIDGLRHTYYTEAELEPIKTRFAAWVTRVLD